MKKNILLLAIASIGLVSCAGWLDRQPKATLTPENFFNNEAELQVFSNQFYRNFPSSSLYEERVDNIAAQELSREMMGVRPIPASGGGWSWDALRDYNTLLQYSSNCKDTKVREQYDALARFFRAYFYLAKVQRFGDVPWYDRPLESNDPELMKPRDSREFVMQKMLEDVDYAIENLPATKDVYRITKWTALALKSRICLFEGTFRKYHNINIKDGKDWKWYLEQCEEASKDFITSSGYRIYTDGGANASYFNLFSSDQAIDAEIILARDYDATLKIYHNASEYTINRFPGMTKKIVDSYLMNNGTRYTETSGWETKQFKDEFKNRDPRLAQTIVTPGYKRNGGTEVVVPNIPSATVTGYQLIKFTQGEKSGAYSFEKSYNDLPLFRTAEVYLNYAEAKAELGTLTQADLDMSIKKIRDRVGMPNIDMAAANANPDPYLTSAVTGYPNVKGNNQGVILEIRRERTIELFQEGFRYNDIMRWKEGKILENKLTGMYFPGPGQYDLDGNGTTDICIYKGTKPSTGAKTVLELGVQIYLSEDESGYIMPHKNTSQIWDENKDYLYPIPTDDRALTGLELKQNPGWNDGLD